MTIVLVGLLLQDSDVAELIRRLGSEQVAERDAATTQIRRLGPSAEKALREAEGDSDPEVAARVRHLLRFVELSRRLPPRLIDRLPVLAERLADDDPHAWTQVFLGIHADPAKSRLLRRADLDALAPAALRGVANRQEQQQVIDAIRRWRLTSAVPALVEALSDPSERLYGSATSGLQSMGIRIDDPKLARLLAHDNETVRRMAGMVLDQVAHHRLIPTIVELLADPRPEVRTSALTTLSRLDAAEAAPDVAKRLSDPEPAVRAAAARALTEAAGYRWASEVEPLLNDPDPVVASAAIDSLGLLRFRRALPAIKAMLGDSRPGVRRAAAAALGRLDGAAALPQLLKALEDPDSGVRAAVLPFLGGLPDPGVLERVAEALEDSDMQVRRSAAEALGRIGGPGVLPALEAALDDPDSQIRYHVLKAFGTLRVPEAGPLIFDLIERNGGKNDQAVRMLQQVYLSPETVKSITKLLDHEAPYVRQTAAGTMVRRLLPLQALVGHKDEKVRGVLLANLHRLDVGEQSRILADALKDPSVQIRTQAVHASAAQGFKEHGPSLVAALKDSDPGVRVAAVNALADLEARESGEAILALIDDSSPAPRDAAFRAAGRLKLEAARERVLTALQDAGRPEFAAAAEAAGLLGLPEAVPLLKAGLDGADVQACLAAAGALARMGHPEGVTELLALTDEGEGVSHSALAQLESLGRPELAVKIAERLVRLDRYTVDQAIRLLGDSGVPEVAPVLLAFWRDYPNEARSVPEALAKLGSRDVVPAILEMLRSRGTAVGASVAQVLKGVDAREAIPALLEMSVGEDPSAAAAALLCLGEMGAAEAEPRAIALLDSPDEQLCASALTALGKLGGDESVEPVLKRLNHPAPALRVEAAAALARLQARQAGDRILALLEDPSAEVRFNAAWALTSLEDPRVLPYLKERLKYGDEMAASWLCWLGCGDGVDLLMANPTSGWLFTFNRLAAPEVWRRLEEILLQEDMVGTRTEILQRVARAAGLELEALPSKSGSKIRVVARKGRDDLLGALQAATEDEWVILGPDRIRVVSDREGIRFWRQWRSERP